MSAIGRTARPSTAAAHASRPSTPPRRARRRRAPLAAALLAGAVAVLAACGQAGSSGGGPVPGPAPTGGGATSEGATACPAVAGDELVVLTDDKHLQNADNVIPAVNAKAVADDDTLLPLLDSVSAKLDTAQLVALNKAVDVERQTSAKVAQKWVDDNGLTAQDSPKRGSVTVGAANFSESATLANIYADVLKSAGYTVKVQDAGSRETYLPALEKGQLTVFPEYTSTLTEFINKDVNGANATPLASSDLDKTVAALTDLGTKVGLVFGKPAAAQDQNAFAVTAAFAAEHHVRTLTELAAACSDLVLGGPPECTERPFCQPGLEQTYGLRFSRFTSLDSGGPLTKTALQRGQIALGLVLSSDGQLSTATS